MGFNLKNLQFFQLFSVEERDIGTGAMGQKTACKSLFPYSTVWVLGIELRLSVLAANICVHWTLSLAQEDAPPPFKIFRIGSPS